MKNISLRKKINLCIVFVWIGAILALLSGLLGDWSLWLGVLIFGGASFVRFGLLRCPHCGQPLSERRRIPDNCPACGGKL
jgi:hypothetical protein